jgi:hypothetical protein
MKRSGWLAVAVVLAALPSGCVTRRYLITSDPPGAVVYRDGQPIGATPVEEPFLYYGKYRFRLVKDGFQPLDVTPELCPPWYEYPGVDFVAEALFPFPLRDVQLLHFQLQPLESVRPDEVRARAEELRSRGAAIQTPPAAQSAPRIRQAPAAPSLPAPTPAPTTPFPPPTPAEGVTDRPAPAPAPAAPSSGGR